MRAYSNKPIEELAKDLVAGLERLKKGYVDAAEALGQIIQRDRQYPYEFIVFRITGYRPARTNSPGQLISGQALSGDLQTMILDLCDSFEFKTSEYIEPVNDIAALCRRFNVSSKTIQRWTGEGLVARRLVFPDGRRRQAFLDSSVHWFVSLRQGQMDRAMRFSKMSDTERADLIRRAARMVGFSRCSMSEVARRLSARTGRAVETIRYTIRRHDLENPRSAIFGQGGRLDEQERLSIYQDFLRGQSAPALARGHGRTRGNIYRVVTQTRARQLLRRPIGYIYNAQFDLPNADEIILAETPQPSPPASRRAAAPDGIPPYLQALYDVPLLGAEQEREMFRRYNYLKYKADMLRKHLDLSRVRSSQVSRIETLLLHANMLKNQIVRANLRLVVSIAKKHMGGPLSLFELISDGNVSLMRAVEKFDYARGYRFSTYASWAIMRNFARTVPRERFQLDRFATGQEEVVDLASSLRLYDGDRMNLPELRESIDVVLARLKPVERSVLMEHYGLNDPAKSKTLDELGRNMGISKERVRQIEMKALTKLRAILRPQRADLLT